MATGVGVWGHRSPVNWAWDIVNFVFWIGIGHAGTLISAILCLLRQKWRTSINRSAEAMTIFAVVCAGIFPVFHVGRVWYAWFLFPLPNSNYIWQNYRSPLEWDVFAVSTYGTVSVLFWYVGMIPDLATMRDRLRVGREDPPGEDLRVLRHGLARLEPALEQLRDGLPDPGRHLDPARPLGAHDRLLRLRGLAPAGLAHDDLPAVLRRGRHLLGLRDGADLILPLRAIYHLEDLITQYHIDCMCKVILATGTMVGYAYAMEFFIAWYGANPYEGFAFINRAFGPYWWAYFIMVTCNVVTPQFFWFKAVRENTPSSSSSRSS